MRITKKNLRRIIKEEKRRLLSEQGPPVGDPVPPEELEAAVLEVFFAEGQVTTADIFDRMRMDGYSDLSIDTAIDTASSTYPHHNPSGY